MILEQMAVDLDLSTSFIQSIARGASYEYKVYQIPKRTGGMRTIHHPSRRLKALQRWLLINVIAPLPVHTAATAYRKGRSIFDNANAHAASSFLLRMDLSSFFESIREADIRSYIVQHPSTFAQWTDIDADILCQVVCRKLALTIGAPSSPALSNALCYEMDVLLTSICEKNQVTYTRYADDLFFSTKAPDVLHRLQREIEVAIGELPVPAHLKINASKTRHSSRRGTRRITGIVLGSDGHAYIGRDLKRKIRALIFNFAALSIESRIKLAGLIAYAKGLDPEFVNSLINKYGLVAVRQAMRPPTSDGKAGLQVRAR